MNKVKKACHYRVYPKAITMYGDVFVKVSEKLTILSHMIRYSDMVSLKYRHPLVSTGCNVGLFQWTIFSYF